MRLSQTSEGKKREGFGPGRPSTEASGGADVVWPGENPESRQPHTTSFVQEQNLETPEALMGRKRDFSRSSEGFKHLPEIPDQITYPDLAEKLRELSMIDNMRSTNKTPNNSSFISNPWTPEDSWSVYEPLRQVKLGLQQTRSLSGSVIHHTPPASPKMTHLLPSSEVHMVSIAGKEPSRRIATAMSGIKFTNRDVVKMIRAHSMEKGDVLAVARIAGIMAVKKTSDIVPLCHPGLGIESVEIRVAAVDPVDLQLQHLHSKQAPPDDIEHVLDRRMKMGIGTCGGVRIACTVQCFGKTGVEMEALTGAMVAALTVVDMCKAVDKHIEIRSTQVIRKEGGRSGPIIVLHPEE